MRKDIKTEELASLYEAGSSVGEISKQLGIPKPTVTWRLKKLGGILRTNGDGIRGAIKKGYMKPPFDALHPPTGSLNPRWKGGRRKIKKGYILIRKPDHPRASDGYVFEHIFVWEKCHNKPVPKGYQVHHMNGIKDDNRPSNLLALTKRDHHRLWAPYQQRIRELEQENARLRQMNFVFD